MYAVLFQVDMKPDFEGDVDAELDRVVADSRAVPGYVRGTWATDGKRAVSFIVCETEESAREMAGDGVIPPEASVTFRSVDVFEISRDE